MMPIIDIILILKFMPKVTANTFRSISIGLVIPIVYVFFKNSSALMLSPNSSPIKLPVIAPIRIKKIKYGFLFSVLFKLYPPLYLCILYILTFNKFINKCIKYYSRKVYN